jgi:hypothetical protein
VCVAETTFSIERAKQDHLSGKPIERCDSGAASMSICALADTQKSLQELCDGLRTNDPTVTQVEIRVHEHTKQRDELLLSLQRNTTVTSLILNVTECSSTEVPEFNALCRYLEQCESINAIEFRCYDTLVAINSWRFVPILRSMVENPSLELVKFQSTIRFPSFELDALLQVNSHCLKQLLIGGCGISWGVDAEAPARLRQSALAVCSLQVLERLCFAGLHCRGSSFALGLLHSRTCLRELSILGSPTRQSNMNTINALSSLLHSGVPLDTLSLVEFTLDKEMVESLVRGLGCCRTLMLTADCDDGSAVSDIADVLGSSQRIHRLSLTNSCLSTPIAVNLAAAVLRIAEQIGSSLQVLDVDCGRIDDIRELLRMLTKKECRLSSLTLSHVDKATWLQVIQYLPLFLGLRELKLGCWNNIGCHQDAFLHAMRKNGSLHEVSIFTLHGQKQLRPSFEGQPVRTASVVRGIQRFLQNPNLTDTGVTNEETPSLLHLLPSLCRVAMQAPRMAATTLAGLLTDNDSIGPHRRGKRKRSGTR